MEPGNRCHFCYVKSIGTLYKRQIAGAASSAPSGNSVKAAVDSKTATATAPDLWFAGADSDKVGKLRSTCYRACMQHPTLRSKDRMPPKLFLQEKPTVYVYAMGHNHHPDLMTCSVPTPPMGPKVFA
jgi:hypothetical protein